METMDTLKITKRLVTAGATQKLAEEFAEVIKETTDSLSTKQDLKHLEEKIEIYFKSFEGNIKKDFERFQDSIREGQQHFVTKDDLHKISNKIVWTVIMSAATIIVFLTKSFPFINNLLK